MSMSPRAFTVFLVSTAVVSSAWLAANLHGQEEKPFHISQAHVGSMTMSGPPQGIDGKSVSLFDGNFWTDWRQRDGQPSQWMVRPDHSVRVHGGDAVSNGEYGDLQLHLEFKCPKIDGATGQARGNSGVYIQGRYEIQVLDSFGLPPSDSSCGGIYGQHTPLVNAAYPAEVWQTYDIVFRAPRFDEKGEVVEKPRMTVLLNGQVIHNNVELSGPTPGGLDSTMSPTGPILLQDHGDAVEYRNIWVRPL
ncbi:MAG: DUF1080 domain-containing protein [Phycisphaerales bacterium]|nr:DUF1080 domain-containing protein [Phycisphaerales bacterium]